MKVLHIITRMNTGGPAVFLDHLTKSMADLGTKSVIAYGFCESNETDYTDTHKLNAVLIRVKSLHRSLSPISDIRSFFQLRKIIKTQKPDLVNTHTSKAGALGRLAAKSVNKKIPVIHTFHGHLIYGYFAKYKSFIFTLIERALARLTNAAVCITSETQDSLLKSKIGRKLTWKVIRLGIPLGETTFSPIKESERIQLLWVGRFTDIKDPFYAVSVLSELESIAPNKYQLKMIGGGELLDKSKQAASNLPITFTGWVDAPFETSGYFDLLLLTSKNEGMGLVMLEAARLRKATVGKNVGGVGEFLVNDVNGLIIDGQPEDMAREINKLAIDDIQRLGNAAYEELAKNFSDKRLAKEYFDLYQSLSV
jgi:glycosyltransferase involved in cell wall biosynthesis